MKEVIHVESFLDLIFSNLFLIIIVLSSIFGMLNKNKEEKEKNPSRPKPVQTPSRPINKSERPSRPIERSKPVAMKSVEEQQHEQMERLRERFKIDESDNFNETDLSERKTNLTAITKKNVGSSKSKLNKELELKYNQKSVIQGIMMSEILGAPRSRKPYRSVIEERKIK